MIPSIFIFVSLTALALYITSVLFFRKKGPAPLPPGPKPLPLVGNLPDLPPAGRQEWVHWLKFKDRYGMRCLDSTFPQAIKLINHQVL